MCICKIQIFKLNNELLPMSSCSVLMCILYAYVLYDALHIAYADALCVSAWFPFTSYQTFLIIHIDVSIIW